MIESCSSSMDASFSVVGLKSCVSSFSFSAFSFEKVTFERSSQASPDPSPPDQIHQPLSSGTLLGEGRGDHGNE